MAAAAAAPPPYDHLVAGNKFVADQAQKLAAFAKLAAEKKLTFGATETYRYSAMLAALAGVDANRTQLESSDNNEKAYGEQTFIAEFASSTPGDVLKNHRQDAIDAYFALLSDRAAYWGILARYPRCMFVGEKFLATLPKPAGLNPFKIVMNYLTPVAPKPCSTVAGDAAEILPHFEDVERVIAICAVDAGAVKCDVVSCLDPLYSTTDAEGATQYHCNAQYYVVYPDAYKSEKIDWPAAETHIVGCTKLALSGLAADATFVINNASRENGVDSEMQPGRVFSSGTSKTEDNLAVALHLCNLLSQEHSTLLWAADEAKASLHSLLTHDVRVGAASSASIAAQLMIGNVPFLRARLDPQAHQRPQRVGYLSAKRVVALRGATQRIGQPISAAVQASAESSSSPSSSSSWDQSVDAYDEADNIETIARQEGLSSADANRMLEAFLESGSDTDRSTDSDSDMY